MSVSRKEALAELWERGNIHWKLHDTQLEMYHAFHMSRERKYIFNCSRRLGKSFLLCLIAVEFAIQNDGSRICYAAPTAKSVKKIILPIMKEILKDCPARYKPKWAGQDHYVFPNGSEIHIAGTDNERAESLRGQNMHLGICDEASFMSNLDYVVGDILMPQTLTTSGRIIIASTPPKIVDHDFKTYALEAEIRGSYMKKTIYDNPMLSKELIISVMKETDPQLTWEEAEKLYEQRSGPPNTTWRREYMAEFVKDEKLAIIPEFTEDLKKACVLTAKRPQFYDTYTTMDVGFNDFTFVLFGYWDFYRAKLVIEDEFVMQEPTSKIIATNVKQKEHECWGPMGRVYMRYSDTDLIVISDLQREHDLTFIPTRKDMKEAAVNKVRIWFKEGKIEIHPRCKNLIAHLEAGIWNKNKTSFARSTKFGHYDGIDALIYMVRNVNTSKNPTPPGHGLDLHSQHINPKLYESPSKKALKDAFNTQLRKHFNRDIFK